jgi:hypothetical protein
MLHLGFADIYLLYLFFDMRFAKMSKSRCRFSVDATGKNKQRLDYNGGIENVKYFLQNGGFINTRILPNSSFKIENKSVAPKIEVDK